MAFKLPSNTPTTNKTVRFPNDLIGHIEKLITGTDCTFSAFIIAAARALDSPPLLRRLQSLPLEGKVAEHSEVG